jgi:hypothetical protein
MTITIFCNAYPAALRAKAESEKSDVALPTFEISSNQQGLRHDRFKHN